MRRLESRRKLGTEAICMQVDRSWGRILKILALAFTEGEE